MALLSLQGVTLNLGGKTLLDTADLHVEQGERVCLVGRNGVGKSSLMALLSGDLTPDGGTIVRTPGVTFGHMPQAVPDHWSGPVFGVVASGLGKEGEALAAAHLIATGREAQLSAAKLALARDLLQSGEGWERHGDILEAINQLGLDPEADFATLSGGNKRRVALARALVASENLLLDEPTNHLDIKTIAWLEDFLVRRVKTFVFISHDRAFVRRLATRIVEVDRSQLYSYACTFDQFLERREERLDAEEKQAAAFDKKLAQEEAWIRQGIKARRTRNMGRVRALQAMRSERMARVSRQGVVSMLAQEAERSGKLVIEAKQAGFAYPDGYRVFNAFSTIIQRGDRIGLIGNNGVGKTTLLRLLLGELEPTEGSIRHGTRLEVSYFDQLRSSLDPEKSVMDNVANGNDTVTINGQQRHVASYLMDFLFESDRLRVPVHTLSGGERNRLLLAKLFTMPSNLLVLDEPTNDLDVETLELLEELLASYSGTVLMVSHDREFLDGLVDKVYEFRDGRVKEHLGGIYDFLRDRQLESMRELDRANSSAAVAAQSSGPGTNPVPGNRSKGTAGKSPANGATSPAKPALSGKELYTLKREADKQLRKAERDVEQAEEQIMALEKQIAGMDKQMADPAAHGIDLSDGTLYAQYNELKDQLSKLTYRWEELNIELENAQEAVAEFQ